MIIKAGFSPGWDNSKAWEVSIVCEAIKRRYGSRSGLKVLDIGGGQGILPIFLYQKGHIVNCIDPEPVKSFVRWVNHMKIRYDKGTIFSLPYPDDHFDMVSSICVLEHIRSFPGEPERWQEIVGPTAEALLEIARVLKPKAWTVHTVDFHFPELGMQYAAYSKQVLLEIFKRLEAVFEVVGEINYDVDISTYFLQNERVFEAGKEFDESLNRLKQGLLPELAVTKASFVLRKL